MEFNVVYKNSESFLVEDRNIIEETLMDVAGVAFDAKLIQLKIEKKEENQHIECQINIIKNTETLSSDLISQDCLTDSLENVKTNILDKILAKNVFNLSNAA